MSNDNPSSLEPALAIVGAAEEKKAEDIIVLDVREICSFADYFILCSGQNTRHTQAIAESVRERLARLELRPLHVEGEKAGSWILMDYADLIVHIFMPETRAFYDLERLWGDAEAVDIEQAPKLEGPR